MTTSQQLPPNPLLPALAACCALAASLAAPVSAGPISADPASAGPQAGPAPAAVEEAARLDPAAAVAAARAALGWDRLERHPGLVRVTGSARMLGTDARQTELFDGRGRWLQSFEGPLGSSSGFDGETAWSVDWNRTPRVLELGDRDSSLVAAAFLSGAWTAGGGGLRFDSAREVEGLLELHFEHPNGALTGALLLDPHSHLPREVSWRESGEGSRWTFGPYREQDGFRFPSTLKLVNGALEQGFALETLELLAAPADDPFAPRLAPPDDARFDPEVPAALEVRRVPSGHLLVHPRIDGKDLGWFIFDTGAGINCISSAVADELAEGPFGQIGAQGIGGTVMSPFWRAGRVELGPVRVDELIFMELDLGFLSGPFGVDVGGIIGFELIARCAVEFDQTTPAIALHDPGTYELPAAAQWEEVLLVNRHPNVRATFEGHPAVFKVDTGAAGDTLAIHTGAIEAHALLADRATRPGLAGGVGGQVEVRIGAVDSFVLGGRELGPFDASFATEDRGAFANDHVWGHIGGQLMAPFVVVFDYSNKRLAFVPREAAGGH